MGNKEKVKLMSVNAFLLDDYWVVYAILSSFLLVKGLTKKRNWVHYSNLSNYVDSSCAILGKISDQSKNKKQVLYLVCLASAVTSLIFYLVHSFLGFVTAAFFFQLFSSCINTIFR